MVTRAAGREDAPGGAYRHEPVPIEDVAARAAECLREHGRDIDLPLWADKHNPRENRSGSGR